MRTREELGRHVRKIWIDWARQQPSPKPSWLLSWEELSEPDREVDRRIGTELYEMGAWEQGGADTDARRAPVQSVLGRATPLPAGTIAWTEHVEAWTEYARRFGRDQSAERIAERGGFGMLELCSFLGRPPRTWRQK